MSIAGFSDPGNLYKKSTHWRNNSGELDVFEAARYFSGGGGGGGGGGGTEFAGFNGAGYPQKTMKEERQVRGGGRMSLDMPTRNQVLSQPHRVEKQSKEKKYKQPSSPGGKLASFLNSLFNQTTSKKKKSKSTTQSVKDEEESPGGRRKRRSSISHFRSASATDSKTIYSSSNSGFRTPPPCANTSTKIYKDLRSYSDHKQVVTLSKCNGQVRSMALQDGNLDEKRNMDFAWLDEKLKFHDGFSEKNKSFGILDKNSIWVDGFSLEDNKNFTRFTDEDKGGDSDSSSDLFELQNYDLGLYSSGLPVYETTHMESIKRGAPISNASL